MISRIGFVINQTVQNSVEEVDGKKIAHPSIPDTTAEDMAGEQLDKWQSRLIDHPIVCNRLHARAAESVMRETSLTAGDDVQLYPTQRGLNSFTRRCSCLRQQSTYGWKLSGVFRFRSSTAGPHSPSCELFNSHTWSEKLVLEIYWPKLCKTAGSRVTLKITRGARACVLSRALVCGRMIPDSHPFHDLVSKHTSISDTMEEIRRARREMNRMLCEGELTPKDKDKDGEPILQGMSIVSYL